MPDFLSVNSIEIVTSESLKMRKFMKEKIIKNPSKSQSRLIHCLNKPGDGTTRTPPN